MQPHSVQALRTITCKSSRHIHDRPCTLSLNWLSDQPPSMFFCSLVEVCRSLIFNVSVPAPIYTLQASSFRPPLIRNKPTDLNQRVQKHTQKPRINLNNFYPQPPPYNTTLLLLLQTTTAAQKQKDLIVQVTSAVLPSPSNSSNSRSQSRRNPQTHQHEPNIKQHNRSLGVSIPIPPRKSDKTKRGMRSF
ncbi:uncharacterized protein K441DRAFT_344312 [Cenococcum geophilum 1.58]|uniref:uncharacterized protein n=1 Tax=Cenococcum geophilum 1.58 TaxID=794803 RepID=UPI00358E2A32|nr:hypothetical protein K441DRAFT_344312 [Cenococcum geophilum 1.58]